MRRPKLACALMFFLSWFGAWAADEKASPSQASARSSAAKGRSPIGTGLAGLNYWDTEFPFLDLFKSAGPWLSATRDTWEDPRPLDLDGHGWVRSLKPGQFAVTMILWDIGTAARKYVAGRYVVTYDGKGTLEYAGSTKRVETAPGRDVFEFDPNGGEGIALLKPASFSIRISNDGCRDKGRKTSNHSRPIIF